ncbi:hypothetical protein MBLNU459_g2550t1 [Dothideomycetes sp. NU459]
MSSGPGKTETTNIQIPDWDNNAIKRKPVASNTDAPPAYDANVQHKEQAGFKAKLDSVLSPHRSYLGLKRRTFLIVLGCVLLAVLALIIGLAVGLTRHSSSHNLPLPTNSEEHVGDLTYYGTGLGSCGITSSDSDDIVAVSHIIFDAASTGSDPNSNPLCGKMIRAERYDEQVGARRSVDLKVVDRCTGCAATDLDIGAVPIRRQAKAVIAAWRRRSSRFRIGLIMKFLSVAALALLSATVSARSTWLGSSANDQNALEEAFPVPGDNPLAFCAKPDDNILEIEKVDLSPNPPSAGDTLTIKASGIFHEDVEEGAKVHLQVKYGLIRIINQEADLCDNVKNVDLECPLKKGPMTLTKDVELPKEIPPGKYTVLADVYDKDQKKITCLQATIIFKRGGAIEVVN